LIPLERLGINKSVYDREEIMIGDFNKDHLEKMSQNAPRPGMQAKSSTVRSTINMN